MFDFAVREMLTIRCDTGHMQPENKKSGLAALRARRLCIFILLALPLLSCVWFVASFGVNVPFQDDWSFVSLMAFWLSGKMNFLGFFFYQHNDHKLFIPYMTMLAAGRLTDFNWVSFQFCSLIYLGLTNLILFKWAAPWLRREALPLLALLPVSLALCSLRQWWNLLFGLQISIFSVNFFFVATVLLLQRARKVDASFLFAALAAILCSYCNGNGILSWTVGALQLFLFLTVEPKQERKCARQKLLTWLSVSAIFLSFYLATYRLKDAYRFHIRYLTENLDGVIKFALGSFGTPYAYEINSAVFFGALFLVCALLSLWSWTRELRTPQQQQDDYAKFKITAWMLVLYGVVFNLLIIYGRIGLGVDKSITATEFGGLLNAICSRYASFGCISLIGLYLIAVTARPMSHRLLLTGIALSLVAACTYASINDGLPNGEQWHDSRLVDASILRNYKIESDDALKRGMVRPELLRKYAPQSERFSIVKLHETGEPPSAGMVPDPLLCRVQSINGLPVSHGQTYAIDRDRGDICIKGFVLDPQTRLPVQSVWMYLDEQPLMRIAYGLNRPDISSLKNRLRIGHTGFEAVFARRIVSKGLHTVSLRAVLHDGKRCAKSETLLLIEIL